MRGDETGTFRFEHVHIEAMTVDVAHEHFAVILFRPGAALVNHQTAMGMAAAVTVRGGNGGPRIGPLPMQVIGDGLDVGIGIGVEMRSCLSVIAAALNDVESMGNDTSLHECLAVLIEV